MCWDDTFNSNMYHHFIHRFNLILQFHTSAQLGLEFDNISTLKSESLIIYEPFNGFPKWTPTFKCEYYLIFSVIISTINN